MHGRWGRRDRRRLTLNPRRSIWGPSTHGHFAIRSIVLIKLSHGAPRWMDRYRTDMETRVLLKFVTLIITIRHYYSTNLLNIWDIASKLVILVTFCNEQPLET